MKKLMMTPKHANGVVLARFLGTAKDYAYFVRPGDEPAVGDFIVTSFSREQPLNDAFHDDAFAKVEPQKLNIARIVGLTSHHNLATKFYLKHISVPDLVARMQENKTLVEAAERRNEARKELEAMLREQSEVELYRKLATSNPRAKKLLAILEGEDD